MADYGFEDVMTEDSPIGASASAKKTKPKSGEVSRVEIEPSDNGGFTVTCFHKSPKSTKRDSPVPYQDPVKSVYADAASMLAYVGEKFGEADE